MRSFLQLIGARGPQRRPAKVTRKEPRCKYLSYTCQCKDDEVMFYCADTRLIWPKAIPDSSPTLLPHKAHKALAAGPTSAAPRTLSQHQHSDFVPCSWYWYLLTAKITFWEESSGMLYKIITPGSTLPCVSLYFKMKVRKIARCLTQEEPVWEITLHPASHFVLFCFFSSGWAALSLGGKHFIMRNIT